MLAALHTSSPPSHPASRILDNFGERKPTWSRDDVLREGTHFVIDLKTGESITATLPAPDAPPPAPPNVSMPLKVTKRLISQTGRRTLCLNGKPVATQP